MVVRRAPGLVVREIAVPPAVRAADPSVPANVWRVRVAGHFPPRALRYIVSAGGHPVGYGTPSFHMNAAVAVTADPAVVTDAVTARYEGADEAAVPGTAGDAPSAAQAARSLAAQLGDGAHPTLDVARRLYSLGDQAYQPPGIQGKVELAGDVHYPKDLTQGPLPARPVPARQPRVLLQGGQGRIPMAVPAGLDADAQRHRLRLHGRAAGELRLHRRLGERERRERAGQPAPRHRHAPARLPAAAAPGPVAASGARSATGRSAPGSSARSTCRASASWATRAAARAPSAW